MERILKKKNHFYLLLLAIPVVFYLAIASLAYFFISNFNAYIIYNGDDKSFHISKSDIPADVLTEAGITLSEDKYAETSGEVGFVVNKIEILKKDTVNLTDGTNQSIHYIKKGHTVSEFFEQNNIIIGNDDIVTPDVTSEISDNIQISITRVSFKTAEETTTIPFTTEKRNSSSMNKGTSRIVQNGANGTKKITYNVKYVNGKEESRTVTSETVTKQPVSKIVEYGTKPVSTSGVVTTKDGQKLNYKRKLSMTATAYTTERTSDKITATGKVARVGYVAVDPKVIPLHSKLYIVSADGKSWCYGIAVAEDTGVRGNKIDLFFNTYKECISFGRRKATVYVL